MNYEPLLESISPLHIPLLPRDTPLVTAPYTPNGFRPVYACPSLVPPPTSDGVCAVFDLDETLVEVNEGEIFLRPYTIEALDKLVAIGVEIIVWSAGSYEHVSRCLGAIDEGGKRVSHVICRGATWVSTLPSQKDVNQLCGRANRAILIDNTPYCASADPGTSIIVPSFSRLNANARNDTTLLYVIQIVARCHALLNVSDIRPRCSGGFSLEHVLLCHPFLVRHSHLFCGECFECYSLDVADSAIVAVRIATWMEPAWAKRQLRQDSQESKKL